MEPPANDAMPPGGLPGGPPGGAVPVLRLAMHAVPGCAALVNVHGGLEAVNEAWAKASGPNPFVSGLEPGCDYLDHCRTLAKSENGNYSLVAVGIVAALQGRIRHIRLEYPVPGQGSTGWFSMTATGLQDGSGVVVAHLDVTERMALETRLRRSEQLFKATTENALDLIAIVAADGRTVYLSPSYGKTLGHPVSTLSLGGLLDLVCVEDRDVFQENCRLGLNSGISPLFEYDALHKDGRVLHLEARAVAVDNPVGERDSILLISRDISAKKRAEAERARMETQLRHAQKMEAVGQLSAGIAHEINTPCQFLSDNLRFLQEAFAGFIAVVASLNEVLEAPADGRIPDLEPVRRQMSDQDIAYLSEEVPRALQQSQDGLERIATIVKAMKVFGHPGGERPVPVDLNETLRNTVVVAQGEWKYVAEVVMDLAAELPRVSASPGEMNQVFLNLIVNAAHAVAEKQGDRPGEKGKIVLSSRSEEAWVEVRVEDTGAGIPEAIRGQIFLPFFTTKPVGKGTGQGLSIVHSVVTKAGGTIDFESVVGQGTCFIVRLPIPGA